MDLLEKMEIYARDNFVPIARKDNIEYLKKLIEEESLFEILELGSAIGYSAICMASVNESVHVTTIERNEDLYVPLDLLWISLFLLRGHQRREDAVSMRCTLGRAG